MSNPSPETRAAKAIAYAEMKLGVHTVAEAAVAARERLDDAFTEVATLRDARRVIEDAIQTRELEIYSDERGKHADLSQAALERHLKVELHKDAQLIEWRSKLSSNVSSIEGLEYDIRIAEADIKIAVARMMELSGYFNFLAAVKQTGQTGHTERTGAST